MSGGCLGDVWWVSRGVWVIFMEIGATWMCLGVSGFSVPAVGSRNTILSQPWNERIVCTWDILDIKIPKPPNIRILFNQCKSHAPAHNKKCWSFVSSLFVLFCLASEVSLINSKTVKSKIQGIKLVLQPHNYSYKSNWGNINECNISKVHLGCVFHLFLFSV